MQTMELTATTITAQGCGIWVAAIVKITTTLLNSLDPSRRLRTYSGAKSCQCLRTTVDHGRIGGEH